MVNRYFAPCRYCGGTVQPDAGTLEKVGQTWLTAHIPCVEAQLRKAQTSCCVGGLSKAPRAAR